MKATVEGYMSQPVITIDKSALVSEAFELMEKHSISHVVVTRGGKPFAVVTLRDLVDRLASLKTAQAALSKIRVVSVCSEGLVSVSPKTSLKRAAREMLERDMSSLAVMDGEELVGILTLTDVLKACVECSKPVREGVVESIASVKTSSTLLHVRKLMFAWDLKALAVIEGEQLVGLVTEREVARALIQLRKDTQLPAQLEERLRLVRMEDIMIQNPPYIRLSQTLGEAAEVMVEEKVPALPVLDEEHVLAGMIDRRKVVKKCLLS
ncbi:MAG: hypothetical protein DRN96_07260 [Thermoproteota archaeon]|nr:MAG: hypothetical protein DRN96_07260 [Candidatus Korarchaeota archaeon]